MVFELQGLPKGKLLSLRSQQQENWCFVTSPESLMPLPSMRATRILESRRTPTKRSDISEWDKADFTRPFPLSPDC